MQDSSQRHTKLRREMALRKLSGAIGDFIRYWGFRRIHGQIWTQVFLAKHPLSGSELSRLLKVSKALVSPALSELVAHGLIRQIGGDKKTKTYVAEPDVLKVIQNILRSREFLLVKRAEMLLQDLMVVAGPEVDDSSLNQERLAQLVDMTAVAVDTVDLIVALTSSTLTQRNKE